MIFSRTLRWLVLVPMLCACSAASSPAPQPIPTLRPTVTPSAQAQPTANTADTGWIAGSHGIELRTLRAEQGNQQASITVARLDPAQVRLRVGYSPGSPRPLLDWAKQTDALLVVNGSFFDDTFRATALLVSDSAAIGQSYEGFGGMLAVAPDGHVGIQPLRDQGYDPQQPLEQALQSFPMLIFPGGVDAGVEWDAQRDRRTALALDRQGRLLVIICAQPAFSLNEFATWLQQSDLEIDRALNLDGGSSTGLYVNAADAQGEILPFSRLPIVLYAEPRAS